MRRMMRKRRPAWQCLPVAAGMFVAILIASLLVFRGVAGLLRDSAGGAVYMWLFVLWLYLGLPLATLAAFMTYGHLRWQECDHEGGICDRCGYNLTGNTSGRCPECGCATEFPIAEDGHART